MNVPELLALADFIEKKVPEDHIDMDSWGSSRKGKFSLKAQAKLTSPHVMLEGSCGTTACLAGWNAIRCGYSFDPNTKLFKRGKALGMDMEDFSKFNLGLDYGEAQKLFYFGYWPEQFKVKENEDRVDPNNVPKDVAVARLRHFASTGK